LFEVGDEVGGGFEADVKAHNAVVVEEIATLALQTITANPKAKPLEKVLHEKHFFRKHGSAAYYGQKKGS